MAKIGESTRRSAFRKSQGKCWFCGEHPAEHIEHLTPKACGGTNDLTNLVGACQRCNYAKAGHRVPGNPNWDLEKFRQEVAYRLKTTKEAVLFAGEQLQQEREEAWGKSGQPTARVTYLIGLMDEDLGLTIKTFSFPDEPSFEAYGLDDEL